MVIHYDHGWYSIFLYLCAKYAFREQNTRKLKQEAQRATYRAPEYNVPPFWGISQGDNFCFLIGPKNTNLVEDI